MRRAVGVLAVAVAVSAVALGTGCRAVPIDRDRASRTGVTPVNVAREGAQRVRVDLTMGAGELQVGSSEGSDTVVTGELRYPESWPIDVDYEVQDAQGVLRIEPQERSSMTRDLFGTEARWELDFARQLPYEMNVTLGAGDSELDLGDLDLEDLEVTTGVGETMLDLTGARTSDLDVAITHGVGELVVRVPSGVAVRVTGRRGGIGDFGADGFTAQGDAWVNDAWQSSGPRIEIEVQRGVGDVEFELID